MAMVQSGVILFHVGIWMYVTVLTFSELPPDLGPSGPSFETCETIECPENSKCVDNKADFVSCVCNPGKTGANCTLEDPCLERKTDCPAGKLCFGDCPPNVICEGATGIAHCRGCVSGWTGMHCEKCDGTSCGVEEIKTAESKDGKGSQLICSFAITVLSVFMYVILTI